MHPSSETRVDKFEVRQYLFFGIGLWVVAALVRAAVVHFFGKPPFSDMLWNDAVGWNLAQRVGFTASPSPPYVPGAYRPPGYPAFLALVYLVAGHSFKAAYFMQGVLDATTAVLTGVLAGRLTGRRSIALLAATGYALYPYPAFLCCELTQDILLTFAVMVCSLLIFSASESGRVGDWAKVGACLGIIGLIKPFLLVFGAVALLILIAGRVSMRQKAIQAATLAACAALVITPWMIRNYVVFHDFQPLAAGATGENIALIANEIQHGDEAIPEQQAQESDIRAQRSSLKGFVDGEELIRTQKAAAAAGLRYLAEHKSAYAWLIVRHIPREWLTLHTVGTSSRLATPAMLMSIFVLVLGLAGMILCRARWRQLLLLYATIVLITLAHAPVQVESRYMTPARPAMVIFIAATLLFIFDAGFRAWALQKPAALSAAPDARG